MKVWFAATEATPFIKTGGLADVVGSLPLALAEEGAEVSVVLPNYGQIKEQFKSEMEFLFDFIVPVGWRQQFGAVLRTTLIEMGLFMVITTMRSASHTFPGLSSR